MNIDPSYVPIVIDNGSYQVRAGFGGDAFPRSIVRNCLGVPKSYPAVFRAKASKALYIGDELQRKRGLLKLLKARRLNGSEVDLKVQSRIWHHMMFKELRVAPEEHTCLMMDAPSGFFSVKQALIQCLFEDFNFSGAFLANNALMNLYSHGITSGLSLDIGESCTRVLAFWQGYSINSADFINPIGGVHIDHVLSNMLRRNGIDIGSAVYHSEVCREIKEEYSYFNIHRDDEQGCSRSSLTDDVQKTIHLPDGRNCNVGRELFDCTECLFQPEDFFIEAYGLEELLKRQIDNCPIDSRKFFQRNIIPCGGPTLIENFDEKLTNTLGSDFKIKRNESKDLSCWTGGSIFSTLNSFSWISKDTYSEFGPEILNRLCLMI